MTANVRTQYNSIPKTALLALWLIYENAENSVVSSRFCAVFGKGLCIKDNVLIDPPYNTQNDSFRYNDSFNHSTWLCFMKNRLEIAKRLLSNTGSIYIQLDYNEVHYCKVLMDEVFGVDCFQREIIWDTQVLSGYKTMVNNWVRGHDSILFYTKKASGFLFNKLRRPQTKEYLDTFNKVDEDGRYYMVAHGTKRYRDEAEKRGRVFGDVWNDIKSFMQMPTASERVDFSTQKPEEILDRIIRSATNEGDIVLDFFLEVELLVL